MLRCSALCSLVAGWLACAAPTPLAVPAAAKGAATKTVSMLTPSRLVPELDVRDVEPQFSEEGVDKILIAGLRILAFDDGRIERAEQRFPVGVVESVPLPERLGGGYLFYQTDSQGTRVWRAPSWTGRLTGLLNVDPTTAEVVPGFDRVYLRESDNDVWAMDAATGRLMPQGPLPVASSLGAMTFADGWRAVVDTELRGPLATFDAGASWWPLGIGERVDAASTIDGDPVLFVGQGYYRLDEAGHVQLVRAAEQQPGDGDVEEPLSPVERRGADLGSHPLRTVVGRGVVVGDDAVIVLHQGSLMRVRLLDGAVTRMQQDVLADDGAECQPVRVGAGDGWVCGVERGPTTIVAFAPPFGVRQVARFEEPRFVAEGGTGALAVRGRCTSEMESDAAPSEDDGEAMRTYCIVARDGSRREIAVRGEVGAERVVALADGRVVVLVPPRLGRPGRITVIDGTSLTSEELRYPDDPRRTVKVARRGLWLEGFRQKGDDAVAGWVEAGGPVVGVTVGLDGEVRVGELMDEGGDLLTSGPLAVVISDDEQAHESIDGGKTWSTFALPGLPVSLSAPRTRGCSRVGCALRGWVRLGWGEPAVDKDLEPVDLPDSVTVTRKVPEALLFGCDFVASTKPDLGEPSRTIDWPNFHGAPAPALGKDEIGVHKGTADHVKVPAHAYVWGGRGADWTRVGWWLLRFRDRFAVGRSVRSSAPTRSLWTDEVAAQESIGVRSRGAYWRWEATMDPGGRGAIANLCANAQCQAFAISDGRPILPLSPAGGATFHKPIHDGAVKVGEVWYLLTQAPNNQGLELWQSSLGSLTRIRRLRRLDPRLHPNPNTPILVRRAHGSEIGLLAVQPPDPTTGDTVGTWLVMPIDVTDGTLGEPVGLGPVDLSGRVLRVCDDGDDGWLVVSQPQLSPSLELAGVSGYIDDIELRLRLEPGSACLDAMSGRSNRGLAPSPEYEAGAAKGAPLSVRSRNDGESWQLRCRQR